MSPKGGKGTGTRVFFAPAAAEGSSMAAKLAELFERTGFASTVEDGALVAIKLHFGEAEKPNTVSPHLVRAIVDEVRSAGGKPFLTDANTLYVGDRDNAVDHLELAYRHGYTREATGAPVVIADGLKGKSAVKVPFAGEEYDSISIAAEIYHADAIAVLTHVTGHPGFGLGASIKNLGMGSGSRAGKQMMHAKARPKVRLDLCKGCRLCAKWCPAEAIYYDAPHSLARIDLDKCIGCGECVATCPQHAVAIDWGDNIGSQRRTADACAGIVGDRPERLVYFNFMLDVTFECDCFRQADKPFVPDIGVLAGNDLVAIDQATADLLTKSPGVPGGRLSEKDARPGVDKLKAVYKLDWSAQIRRAEELGLGSRDYRLIEI